MSVGYLTITTGAEPWPALTRVLRDALARFAPGVPLDVCGINCDVPGLTTRRLDVPAIGNYCWTVKPLVLLTSPWDETRYLDADCVPTPRISTLPAASDAPLMPRHPNPPPVQSDVLGMVGARTQPAVYVHCDLIVTAKAHADFWEEVYGYCLEAQRHGVVPAFGDETVVNAIRARDGITAAMPFCDPYYGAFGRAEYANAIVWHGCKDPAEARGMLEAL